MLDIRLIREQPDHVKRELAKVALEPSEIDAVLALDERRRALITQVEQLRAQRADVSRKIGKQSPEERAALVADMRAVGETIANLEQQLGTVEGDFEDRMLRLPNLPHPSVPVGPDEHANVVIRTEGAEPTFDFPPRPHWEIGEALGVIDFERGVKMSGSRFYVLSGAGALLQRALIQWMLDLHTREHGYREIYGPAMVKRECLVGVGQLPKFAENLYRDTEDDFWFIPTAEVTVTNLYRDEILEGAQLPIYHVAYSPCFRREKMSAGRDVRGIKRGHQFDKVEMVKFVHPQTSDAELDTLVDNAEDVCRRLGIRHRVVQMCTGDLSFSAANKRDVELWAPGCQEWLEVSSCSNFGDFQARRARIRFRPGAGAKPEFVHTLNGSGLALPRVVIAVLETYQQHDGSVLIPPVLKPYFGGMERISGTT